MESQMSLKSESRNVGLDILKILCFFGITMIHFSGYSNLFHLENLSEFNNVLFSILTALAWPTVNVFVLITGFFLCEKTFKINRVLKVWFQVFVVGIIGLIITLILNEKLIFADIVRIIFPVSTYSYWFVTNYLILLILSPFINKMLNSISQNQHLFLCVFGVIWICFIIVMNPFVQTIKYFGTDWNILLFLFLYIVGAYLKKYQLTKTQNILIFVLGIVFLIFETLILYFKIDDFYTEIGNYSAYAFFVSLCIFVLFKNLKINKSSKVLSLFVKSSIFVYLIQEFLPLRAVLWNFVNVAKYAGSYMLVLVYLILMACLYISSILMCLICELSYPYFERFVLFVINKFKKIFTKQKNNQQGETETP